MQVALGLGLPTEFSAGTWVQWDERSAGYGDLSAFADPDGAPRALIRLRIFRLAPKIQFQVVAVPDGSSGFGTHEELSAAWESYSAAITVQAAGLDDLVITGPNSSESDTNDASEPYEWTQGNLNDQVAWFDAYELAGRPAATVIVNDGEAPTTALDLAGRAVSAAPAARGGLELASPLPVDLAGRAVSAAPAARGGLELASPLPVDLAGRAVSAAPAARGGLELASPLPVDLAGRAVSAAPAARGGLVIGDPSVDLAGRAVSGVSAARGGLRVALASEFGVSAAAAATEAARAVLARTGDRILDGAESANQRLRDALLITRGSYPAARDYGSLLAAALDRSLSSSGVGALANAVADAIAHPANGLTDVRLRSVSIDADDGVVTLDIQADWISQAGTLTPIGLREQLAG